MQYLVKEFSRRGDCFDPGHDAVLHLVTDDGDDQTKGSLWNWIWKAKRKHAEVSVYRLDEDISKMGDMDQVLVVSRNGRLDLLYRQDCDHISVTDFALLSSKVYLLKCVLDLS